MSRTFDDPNHAIDTSIEFDCTPRYRGDIAALLRVAAERGYHTDSAYVSTWDDGPEQTRGMIDVWGWTDDTAADSQDWRVEVEVEKTA